MGRAPKKCPVCQSKRWIVVGKDHKGFSVGKAAIGGVLFGPVGLVGGALGKKKVSYYCKDCGFQHEY